MKKLFLIVFVLIGCQFIAAQEALNNYKYIIVPKHFGFQRSTNNFQINELTQFLLNKKGFITVFDDAIYPDDLKYNRCLALRVDLILKSNFTRTKIKIAFVNCDNQRVYISGDGSSKEKELKKAYHEAIRGAFKTFDTFKYKYTPREVPDVVKPKPVVYKETEVKVTSQIEVAIKKPKEKVKDKKHLDKVVAKKHVVIEKKIKASKKKSLKITKKVKVSLSLEGFYKYQNSNYEIAPFKNYYIFSKHLKKGDIPIGFIYKTSQKGSYLLKTTNGNNNAYLKNNGNFIVDEISKNGTIKSVIYLKSRNQ